MLWLSLRHNLPNTLPVLAIAGLPVLMALQRLAS